MKIDYLVIDAKESTHVEGLLNELFNGSSQILASEFVDQAHVIAHELPRRLRMALYKFTLTESATAICVRGNPIANNLPPTPKQIAPRWESIFREEALHILYCSLVGEPFTWSSIQNGNLMNDVIPISENADKPMSSGSSYLFDLHTEDAFHPFRGEYLGLLCLRNPARTPTLLACIDDVRLDERATRVLFEPRFVVGANIAHDVPRKTQRVPLLYGDSASPYLRINMNADPLLDEDPEAAAAYRDLVDQLRLGITEVALEPGDCFILDNLKAAHGRSPYRPEYSGLDRWLKRLYITLDLRKSRGLRDRPESRTINSKENRAYA
jgi:hypothetical protein